LQSTLDQLLGANQSSAWKHPIVLISLIKANSSSSTIFDGPVKPTNKKGPNRFAANVRAK
jgi:hypothetical protein